MCHINVIINKNQKDSARLITCMEFMGYNSSQSNKDGAGYVIRLSDGRVMYDKSMKPIKIQDGVKPMIGFDILATHQRLSTSGHNKENLHPYIRDGFLLMHNGIFNSLGDKDKSDSSYYADMIESAYKDDEDIIKAIQSVHKEVSGYYSIVLYEKRFKRFIYYKNATASMNCIDTPDYLIMSTSKDNIKFAQWFLGISDKDITEIEFKAKTIYDLHTLHEIGEIEDKAYTPSFISDDRDYSGYYYYTAKADGTLKKGYKKLSKIATKKERNTTLPVIESMADYETRKSVRSLWDDDGY